VFSALRLDVSATTPGTIAHRSLRRRSFDACSTGIARETGRWQFTLVILDLDGSAVNDTEGHPAGDAALREFGERFRQC